MQAAGGAGACAGSLSLLASLISGPLRGAVGSKTNAWCGPFGHAAFLDVAAVERADSGCGTTTSASSSAGICTSAGCRQRRGFQSVLRKPIPKALMLNRDSFLEWKSSGFDMKVAEVLLGQAYQKKWERQQGLEARRLQLELASIVKGCNSLADLKLVVQRIAEHMEPSTVVAAICRASRLHSGTTTIGHNSSGSTTQRPAGGTRVRLPSSALVIVSGPEVSEVLDPLLALLELHCDSLGTGQLAAVLSAVFRSGHQLSASANAALQAQLAGDAGLERADAAGPRETAALMLPLARLGWGDPALWERLGEAALAQMGEMAPSELAMVLYAASQAPGAEQSPTLGPAALMWVHAEQLVLGKLVRYDSELLGRVLLSFVASGTSAAGGQLRAEVEARLMRSRSGAAAAGSAEAQEVTAASVVDAARAAAGMLRGNQSDTAGQSLMQHACGAAPFHLTRMSTAQLEQLLSAVAAGYGAGALPPGVAQLHRLAADVMAIRGLCGGPEPSSSAPAACGVLLLLARQGVAAHKVGQLLEALVEPAERMLEQGRLPAASASRLLQAYSLVGRPEGAAAQLARPVAAAMLAGAPRLSVPDARQALIALSTAAGSVALKEAGDAGVVKALRALADRLAAAPEPIDRVVPRGQQRDAVRQALTDAGLEQHALMGRFSQ